MVVVMHSSSILISLSFQVKLDRQFHVVKGVSYKEGVVPTMMLAVANKDAWKEKEGKKSSSSTGKQKQIDSSDVSLQKQKDVDASPSKSKLEDKPKVRLKLVDLHSDTSNIRTMYCI
jgi:hypothetical protein